MHLRGKHYKLGSFTRDGCLHLGGGLTPTQLSSSADSPQTVWSLFITLDVSNPVTQFNTCSRPPHDNLVRDLLTCK